MNRAMNIASRCRESDALGRKATLWSESDRIALNRVTSVNKFSNAGK